MGKDSFEELQSGTKQWLEDHFENIKSRIISEAQGLAEADGRQMIEPRDVSIAAMRYAPGRKLSREKPMTFWQRIGSSISGITLIAGILAVVFGLIGWNSPQEGWIDVAKVFAGIVAGSAGVQVTRSNGRK